MTWHAVPITCRRRAEIDTVRRHKENPCPQSRQGCASAPAPARSSSDRDLLPEVVPGRLDDALAVPHTDLEDIQNILVALTPTCGKAGRHARASG